MSGSNRERLETYKGRSSWLYALFVGLSVGGGLGLSSQANGGPGALVALGLFVLASIVVGVYYDGKANGMKEWDAEEDKPPPEPVEFPGLDEVISTGKQDSQAIPIEEDAT